MAKLLRCRNGREIIVDDAVHEQLADKNLGWNGRTGAYFYVDRKKVYVHRWVLMRPFLKEGTLTEWDTLYEIERQTFSKMVVSFVDRDPTNCLEENLFMWEPVGLTSGSRTKAREKARVEAMETLIILRQQEARLKK